MIRKLTILLLIAFTVQIAVKGQQYEVKLGERPPIDYRSLSSDSYEQGILKIKLTDRFTHQLDTEPVTIGTEGIVLFNIPEVDKLNQQYGVRDFNKLFESGAFTGEFEDRHRAWGFHLWYTLYFDETVNEIELLQKFEQLAEVEIAELEFKKVLDVEPALQPLLNPDGDEGNDGDESPLAWTPNDPYYSTQWHYHNTGQSPGADPDDDIDLPEAWNIETGNSNVIVAIEDMGIQYNHPDLSGNMWSGIGYDFYGNNSSIEPGFHGTHVAGTVAAETNNGTGVSGIAGGTGSNDGVRLMSCQVFTPSGYGGGFHLAPVYAADNGACISQNSWSYTSPNAYEWSVLNAIDYFNSYGGGDAMNGGITIFAAGNDGSSAHYYPGYYSGTFAVAATNNEDELSYYSNYGTWIDISAPGGETFYNNDPRGVRSTYTGSSYSYLQGTSMACPHASGVAALVVSYAYGLLTPNQLETILNNSADDIYPENPGYSGQLGSGRLNAYQALLEAQGYLGVTADFIADETEPGTGQIVTFTDLSAGNPTSWQWTFSPSAGVSYVNGTNQYSQNPQVTFSNVGSYTVSLYASNGSDSDTETKYNYINVSLYCDASGAANYLYIANVNIGDINNSTGQSYYADYTYLSTDLSIGQTGVSISVTNGFAFGNDDLGIWVDWNEDGDFYDAYENIVCAVDNGATGTYYFNVPASVSTGAKVMRVRMKYNGSDCGDPCGTTAYGEVEDYTLNVIQNIDPPVADFIADDTSPAVYQIVNFTDLSTNDPTSWYWQITPATYTFVGGTNASSQNPSLRFNAQGCYTISLTVTNGAGSDTETKVDYICILQAPVADFEADDTSPNVYQVVNFTDLSTNNPTSWTWDVTPGTISYVGGTNANSQNPSMRFNAAGCYTVSLTATNGAGSDTETKVDFICIVQPPIADFEADNTEPDLYEIVNFTDLSTNNPTSWTWDVTPGTISYVGGTNANSQNPSMRFNVAGCYTVSLTATNAAGSDTETKVDYICVYVPPVADFEADNTNPYIGESINFTDLSTNDPDTWSWSFDPPTVTFDGGTTSASQNPQVSFDAGGYYTVSLMVSNNGGSDTETKYDYIAVTGAPEADFEANNTNPFIGETVSFTDLSTNNPDTWTWSFDPPTVAYVGGTTSTSQHPQVTFNATGFYTVSLTVSNGSGNDTETKYDYIEVLSQDVAVQLKGYLEGPFSSGVMQTDLYPLLPMNQPYSGHPWYYPGTESVSGMPDPDIVDWVLVELRDADLPENADESTQIAMRAALLRNDGMILDLDGSLGLTFDGLSFEEELFVVIHHRNHLPVLSNDALSMAGEIYQYDFTTDADKAFGEDEGQVQLSTGEWGMFGGDADADGIIQLNDYAPLWTDEAGTTGYEGTDFNLDGQINNPDKDDIWFKNQNQHSQVPE